MLIENIFYSLFNSSSYFDIVYSHLDERYFADTDHNIIFKKIKEYKIDHTIKQPTASDIKLLIETDTSISERNTESCYNFLDSLSGIERVHNEELLIKETESYVQNRALELAILDSVEILQEGKQSKGCIEEKIKKALAVEFDVRIGTDFFINAPDRYKKYIEKDEYYPCDIDVINIALNGGFRKKSLAVFIGRTNIGKTIWLCHLAASFLRSGKNVLYVSAEMSEDMISKRIDANLLDIPMGEINEHLSKKTYLSKVKDVLTKTEGKLIVKEYATGSANSNHVKNLINEIKMKRGFTPEILILDYLNIFASSRLASSAALNSYSYIKSISEEFRGLGTDMNLAVISATQTNRSGSKETTDIGMDATADSFGLPMSVDYLGAILQTTELFEENKYLLKNLKSRYGDNINTVYTLGVDRPKMRLLNLEDSEQELPKSVKDRLKYEQDKQDEIDDSLQLDFS